LLTVSVFVNPTQFGPGEDYDAYPRDMERDLSLCRAANVDVVFAPSVGAMYPEGSTVFIDEADLSKGLCGARRPGHFRGVLTVVGKLLNIVDPDVALFGRKDAQQVRLVEQMVRDLNFRVRIVVHPTVREPDGLAMSSRNVYLDASQRRRAAAIPRALDLAGTLYEAGERDAGAILDAVRRVIESGGGDLEYAEAVDYRTLGGVSRADASTLVAVAVRFGRTRLIDNVMMGGRDRALECASVRDGAASGDPPCDARPDGMGNGDTGNKSR
jgi:pantoate--beta-alanine ligase